MNGKSKKKDLKRFNHGKQINYDTAQVSQVPLTNTVQALVSMVSSVDVQPSTVISTQPHTKYR